VPNNSEIWRAHIGSTEIDQFDVEYRVLGNIYCDNNAGFNYLLRKAADSRGEFFGSKTCIRDGASARDV
jgi:hypothetical protein